MVVEKKGKANHFSIAMGFSETLKKAGSRALGGGVPGAIAMVLQVYDRRACIL